MTLKLVMHHRVLEYYQVCSNNDAGLTLTYFMARSNLVLYAFVWEKGKTMDFSETIVVCDLKLATDERNYKKFLLTSKLCPLGTVCPLPRGYVHVLNDAWKTNCIKSRLQRDFFETCNKWVKWKDLSVDINILSPGAVCPCPGAICMYWIMKKMYKVRLQSHFFLNLQQMNEVTRHFCWHQNCASWGLSAQAPGLYTCIKSLKKIWLQRDFCETCNKWPKWQDVPVDIKISPPRGCQPLPRGYICV